MPPEDGAPPVEDPPTDAPSEEPEPTTGIVTGVVDSPELEAPLAGAQVVVDGTTTTVATDDVGNFQLELAPGKYTLRFELAGFETVRRTVNISAGGEVSLDISMVAATEVEGGEEVIVVVGSRTARSNLETTVPVDIVTAQEMARTGTTETSRVLHRLAPSFNATPQTIADGTDHIDPASLRGLGPDQVLVLVNGKRRHRSALLHLNGTFGRGTVGVDLNAIPTFMIKRIEILRDGAASQYGSDAIAGVINIVTKDAVDQVELSQTVGVTGSGDGAQFQTAANYGFKLGESGFVNLTGMFLSKGATNRTGDFTGTVYTDDRAMDDAILADNNLSRSDFEMRIGEAEATAGQGGFNLELPTKDGAAFYANGDVSYRRGEAGGFYRFPKQTSQNVPEFYPDGFLPIIQTNIRDLALTTGWRKKSENWDLDVSLTHGRNEFAFNIDNSVNASLGTSSPTTFEAGTLAFAQTLGNVDVVRTIPWEALESLSFVAGGEFRVENYQITAGDEASYSLGTETFGDPPQPKAPGAQVFPGFQPSNEVDRTRNSVGVYMGFESKLTKRITADLGGRFEQYSDFGNSIIGKAATRVEILDGFALRAAASTGFRAPSLHQLWFSNIATQFLPNPMTGVLEPAQVLTSNNSSPVTKAFGIPDLNEETAINFSGGATLRPKEGLSITADAYYIRLRDRIVLTSQFTNANPIVADILTPFPGVSQAQFFANAIDTKTVGVDVVADYSVELGDAGTLGTTVSANFTRTTVTDINIPRSLRERFGADSEQLKTFFFGRLAENRIEDALPRQKGTAAIRYSVKSFGALVRGNYYGRVKFEPDNSANDETFGAKAIFDVSLDVKLGSRTRLTIGADNVFNTFPDRQTKAANISDGRFIYSRNVSQFGINGGFYYTKLELTL